ncbi:hypothetical protein BDR07DRAFT_1474378 [Suillus spraguei]|nr:hypothetical protein BDR07DRAFT_1474378 [Suillus spraguei]
MVDGARLIRSAKSGSDWTFNDLMAYNITVTPQSPEQFFRQNHGTLLEGVDPSLRNSSVDDKNISDAVFEYLGHLDLATNAIEESFIDAFAQKTLQILGFVERGLILTARHNIPLRICGDDQRVAETDDKIVFSRSYPEPQVIAETIAAYQYNNEKRLLDHSPPLDAMTNPCITMVGTRPIFYLVLVTEALSSAVGTGQYPEAKSTVVKCVTSLGHNRRISEGMETPEYRRVAFERFLAFKAPAKEHWQRFVV